MQVLHYDILSFSSNCNIICAFFVFKTIDKQHQLWSDWKKKRNFFHLFIYLLLLLTYSIIDIGFSVQIILRYVANKCACQRVTSCEFAPRWVPTTCWRLLYFLSFLWHQVYIFTSARQKRNVLSKKFQMKLWLSVRFAS